MERTVECTRSTLKIPGRYKYMSCPFMSSSALGNLQSPGSESALRIRAALRARAWSVERVLYT